MNALVKALKTFLSRDLTFLAGGGVVLLAFLHVYDQIPLLPRSGVLLFFPIAFAYIIGYAVQEFFTLLGWVRTKAEPEPNRYAQWLYRKFERKADWTPTPRDDYKRAKQWPYRKSTPERLRRDHERIESLKQVGTTLGPCLLGAAFLLLLPALGKFTTLRLSFEGALIVASTLLGFLLLSLGWLKVTQQREYLIAEYKERSPQKAAETAKEDGAA
jgi:hypothetical protein